MIDLDGDSDDYPRRRSRSRFPFLLVALAACGALAWYDPDLAVVLAGVVVAGYVLHAIAVWLADTGLFLHVLVVVVGVLAVAWLFVPEAFNPSSELRRHMPGPLRRLEQRVGLRPAPSTPSNPDAAPSSGTPPARSSTSEGGAPRAQPPPGPTPAGRSDLRPASIPEEPPATPRVATSITLSVTPAQAAEGEEITLLAVVAMAPGTDGDIAGTVRFQTVPGTVLGEAALRRTGGTASARLVTTLPAGEHTIQAIFSGSEKFTGSTSAKVSILIARQHAHARIVLPAARGAGNLGSQALLTE